MQIVFLEGINKTPRSFLINSQANKSLYCARPIVEPALYLPVNIGRWQLVRLILLRHVWRVFKRRRLRWHGFLKMEIGNHDQQNNCLELHAVHCST